MFLKLSGRQILHLGIRSVLYWTSVLLIIHFKFLLPGMHLTTALPVRQFRSGDKCIFAWCF